MKRVQEVFKKKKKQLFVSQPQDSNSKKKLEKEIHLKLEYT